MTRLSCTEPIGRRDQNTRTCRRATNDFVTERTKKLWANEICLRREELYFLGFSWFSEFIILTDLDTLFLFVSRRWWWWRKVSFGFETELVAMEKSMSFEIISTDLSVCINLSKHRCRNFDQDFHFGRDCWVLEKWRRRQGNYEGSFEILEHC